ncbi:hypothetical protein LB518_13145 [Mesorhizobium sp. BR1-1-16]|uniref:hypothetical protein n=1 Tax=Mesorhizobium sp. BR1-1-16 TaxID=2876653 RepID=UPI001CCB5705|nr:hypothetical protein [Mesorhizobium sp. BR1-1-16]MBZ9937244.1 hypothetical protein [Mesorhizobium sp. BR1-1-16]
MDILILADDLPGGADFTAASNWGWSRRPGSSEAGRSSMRSPRCMVADATPPHPSRSRMDP